MRKGVLTVVSGFSGAGKGTVMKALLEQHAGYALSVSATTRGPRPGEQNGVDYFFLTKTEFEEMIRKDQLLEYAQYVDHYYGTPAPFVEEKLAAGIDVLLEIELQGAMQIRERYPQAVLIFITPPSIQTLKERLTGRGSESEDVIISRLQRAKTEARSMDQYDYLLINDDLEECVDKLHELIMASHFRSIGNKELINDMKESLKAFRKE